MRVKVTRVCPGSGRTGKDWSLGLFRDDPIHKSVKHCRVCDQPVEVIGDSSTELWTVSEHAEILEGDLVGELP